MLRTLLPACALCLIAACSGAHVLVLPSPDSPEPVPKADGLLAGFGREDITPPPGVPIAGYGPEGQQSTGYRHRLYVRALALEDVWGDRIVLAVADLPHVSVLLHRKVAERLEASGTGIGADRFMLSATHAHSAPGNFYEAAQYNEQAAALPGYDSVMVSFMIERIAAASIAAIEALQPAQIAAGSISVSGATRNRSLEAYERNFSDAGSDRQPVAGFGLGVSQPGADPDDHDEYRDRREAHAVDTTLYMIRVDACDVHRETCRPKGAFSVFAVHGTGYPAANALLDGDIHAIVERRLERHIESLEPELAGFRSGAFHLFANGSEGDVRPDVDLSTRCERALRFVPGSGPTGPRRPKAPEVWKLSDGVLTACLERAREEVGRIGDLVGERAIELFDRLEPAPDTSGGTRIRRAFRTLHLSELADRGVLCKPRVGKATLAGSTEDGRTRVADWRLFWVIHPGFVEGGSAAGRGGDGCHAEKKSFLGKLQGPVIGKYGFPTVAQLAVVQIGTTVLAFVPGEPTTAAGNLVRGRIADALKVVDGVSVEKGWVTKPEIVVVGLSNGYLQYVTTRAEYAAQHYEGGSTLYGPQTGNVFADELGRLGASIARRKQVVEVDTVQYDTGRLVTYFPTRNAGPPPESIVRTITDTSCEEGGVRASWIDLYPGRLVPADGPVLEIQKRSGTAGVWMPVASDDDRDVEVYARFQRGSRGYEWEVRWLGERVPGEAYRLVLVSRQGFPELVADVDCD